MNRWLICSPRPISLLERGGNYQIVTGFYVLKTDSYCFGPGGQHPVSELIGSFGLSPGCLSIMIKAVRRLFPPPVQLLGGTKQGTASMRFPVSGTGYPDEPKNNGEVLLYYFRSLLYF